MYNTKLHGLFYSKPHIKALFFVPRHHQLIDFKDLEQVFLSVPSIIYANTCVLSEKGCSN